MREILFRGKRKDNGEWIAGYLIIADERWFILITDNIQTYSFTCLKDGEYIFGKFIEVIPETVGQYTGLTDKNGTKIFKGDIVVMNIKGYNTICKVAWADNVAQFQLWQTNTIPHTPTALNLGNYDCEIIGNIHDNPELLKGA